ncbi:GntR family transcriptional regulator [Luteimonas sp. 3794]|uniref:GntR family transcriptional regulator n=1 Tax=Luteimonas sp. 3794 TaxID=2817730 RepID=UPI0028545D56|nr:GntR family transcriptional regulator [Luteimonas sp. 3794]MDR6993244.1 GntR family transcriptional regulator [Luteimonas sp. 3794]
MDASLLSIQPNAAEPLYRQITGQIRRLVAGGVLQPGEALPSVRDVAALHAINPMTVSKAYSQLEAEGVLLRLRGKGMVVADFAAPPDLAARWGLIDPALDALARQARELELPADALLARLKTRLTEDPQ